MDFIDNIHKTLKEDFARELHSGSKLSIAASCFSIYAFEELKAQANNQYCKNKGTINNNRENN